jgi:predicted lipoprotein with Yx(FWY)xxD motif
MFFGAAAIAGALVLSACSSSSGSASPRDNMSRGGSASGAALVKQASNSRFGSILVDSHGATLYTLTSNGKAVPCTSAGCTAEWPPYFLPAGVTTATGVSGLGTVHASDGTLITHAGLPLYRFAGDTAAGDANGNGLVSFGGVWHVVKASGASPTADAPHATSPSMGGGSGPYGY